MGGGAQAMGNALENSFVQAASNKSYERLLGETIDVSQQYAAPQIPSSGF
jgi:hypothetical protein